MRISHLGQVDQAAGVGNEAGADNLAEQGGQVGRDGGHAVAQVVDQRLAVLGNVNDLRAQRLHVDNIVL